MNANRYLVACMAFLVGQQAAFAAEPHSPKPKGNPGNWASMEDYPAEALRQEQEGTVSFTLAVDADGVPSGCRVTKSSGFEALDQQTCQLMLARARFESARDNSGNAVSGSYANSLRWIIPKDTSPISLVANRRVISFVVGIDGKPKDCSTTTTGPNGETSRSGGDICDIGGIAFQPFTDASGKPVERRVSYVYAVEIAEVGK